jgi:hypothetical protein
VDLEVRARGNVACRFRLHHRRTWHGVAVPVPWRNCGAAGDAVSIQQLDASDWPPQTGKPLTVNVKWVLGEALAKGSFEDVTTTAATGRVREHTESFQSPVEALFDSFVLQQPAPDLRPPIPAGPYNQRFTFKVQAGGPVVAGQQVGVDMTGYDAAGRRVVCMQLTIPIK